MLKNFDTYICIYFFNLTLLFKRFSTERILLRKKKIREKRSAKSGGWNKTSQPNFNNFYVGKYISILILCIS